MGDLHLFQADSEITICGAIEMGGCIEIRFDLIKAGTQTYAVAENAIFMPGTPTRGTASGSHSRARR